MPLRPVLLLLCLLALFVGASIAGARDNGPDQNRGKHLKPVSGLTLTSATPTTLSIDWRAAREHDEDAEDGGRKTLRYDVFLDGALALTTTQTQAQLTGLKCGTDHRIGVRARDTKGRVSPLSTLRASTAECDTTPPTMPSNLQVVDVLETGFTVTWSPSTDAEGVAGYDITLDGVSVGSTTETRRVFDAMSCEETHRVSIVARDTNGNRSAAGETEAKTAKCPDHTPPTAPTGLTVTDRQQTGFTVGWQASSDNEGVTGYDLSLDGTSAGTTSSLSHAFTGLSCGEAHKVSIVARDAAGNGSEAAEIPATTADCPPPPPAADLFVSPTGTDTDQRWRYLATTYDGTTVRLYVDGLEVGSTPASGQMLPSDGALRMGGNNVFSEWFAGLLDEVRLFGRALSPAEIRAEMMSASPQASGLAAAYSFNEGAGENVADSSANVNNGAISGATWAPEGRFGAALAFDGVDDMVSVPDADSLDFADGMTLAGWVKPRTSNDYQTLVTKEAEKIEVYGLWPSTNKGQVPSGHVFIGDYHEALGAAPLTFNDCRSTPCASLQAAYLAARRGEVVQVDGGTYDGNQVLPADRGKLGDGVVLFKPAPGATVTIAGEVFVDGSHVEFRDMRMDSGWQVRAGADDVTFRDVSSAHLFIFSASNVNVLGGEIGPGKGLDFDSIIASAGGGAQPPTNILIKGVRFYDWSRPAGSDFHTECLQIGSAVNLTISGNRFQRCATHDIFIRSWGEVNGSLSPLRNIVIENNFLDETLDGFYTLAISNDLGTPDATFVVRNNSSLQAMSLDPRLNPGDDTSPANASILVYGNIIGFQQSNGCTATLYGFNVMELGTTCGPTDIVASVEYVDRALFDLHLAPGSAAIDRGDPSSFPGVDLDGDARPAGGAPDAGADERG
ncbi:MAG TPA: LamG-like jellyroll fold domain-containing protein [Gaiellaceae bacterium]|nr:LamG-like jellyroll fold domain-containing protein [Gaiellaceae bacterium]